MRAAGVIAAALLTFSMLTSAVAEPFVIDDDDGGQVDTFIMWYARLKASGAPVVLRGICVSACTLVLTLPRDQVCVEPTASLGFHLWSVGGKVDPALTQATITRYYPPAVQTWLAGKKLADWPIAFMAAKEIVSLGILDPCE